MRNYRSLVSVPFKRSQPPPSDSRTMLTLRLDGKEIGFAKDMYPLIVGLNSFPRSCSRHDLAKESNLSTYPKDYFDELSSCEGA